jgi:hypothetical protein
LTPQEYHKTLKNLVHVEAKVEAGKMFFPFVRPRMDGEFINEVLKLIVFNQERSELEEFFQHAN